VEVTRQAELGSGPPGGWLRNRGASASQAFDEVRRALGPGVSDRVWEELGRVRADASAAADRALPAGYGPMLLEWLRAVAEELACGGPTAEAEPTDLHWLRALSENVLHTAEPIVLRGASAFRVSVDVEAALDPGLRLVRAWVRPAEELEPPLLPPDVWLRVHHASRGDWWAWPWCPLPLPPAVVQSVLSIPADAVVAVELRVGGPGRGSPSLKRPPATGEVRGG